jgi:hypothetical protein
MEETKEGENRFNDIGVNQAKRTERRCGGCGSDGLLFLILGRSKVERLGLDGLTEIDDTSETESNDKCDSNRFGAFDFPRSIALLSILQRE